MKPRGRYTALFKYKMFDWHCMYFQASLSLYLSSWQVFLLSLPKLRNQISLSNVFMDYNHESINERKTSRSWATKKKALFVMYNHATVILWYWQIRDTSSSHLPCALPHTQTPTAVKGEFSRGGGQWQAFQKFIRYSFNAVNKMYQFFFCKSFTLLV